MPACDHCDSFVSADFARVFADDDGLIRACLECSGNAGIAKTTRTRAE